MEYAMNDERSHVIRRDQKARNPVEVGVDINDHRVAILAYVNGTFEVIVDGNFIAYEGKF